MSDKRPTNRENIKTLDEVINAFASLIEPKESSQDSAQEIDNLKKLTSIRKDLCEDEVTPLQIAMLGTNLAGILLVLNFERIGVVTSKAFSMIARVKP